MGRHLLDCASLEIADTVPVQLDSACCRVCGVTVTFGKGSTHSRRVPPSTLAVALGDEKHFAVAEGLASYQTGCLLLR